MGIQCFEVQSRAIFIIFGSESKRCPKLAINQLTSALFISNQFYWLKSLMGMESPPCRPPSYWLWRRRRMFQKVALNRLKIEQQVA